jgi:hypothetical protein
MNAEGRAASAATSSAAARTSIQRRRRTRCGARMAPIPHGVVAQVSQDADRQIIVMTRPPQLAAFLFSNSFWAG